LRIGGKMSCIWRYLMSWFSWFTSCCKSCFDWFTCCCCCCKKKIDGEIVLGFGVHEIKIDIPGVPCKVCFDIEDDGCPVCHGDVNKIGIKIGSHGFVIHADIKTNTCLIKWHCEYKGHSC